MLLLLLRLQLCQLALLLGKDGRNVLAAVSLQHRPDVLNARERQGYARTERSRAQFVSLRQTAVGIVGLGDTSLRVLSRNGMILIR